MPYSGPDDPELPENIKKLSANKRKAFVHAFNSVMEHGGKEESAFAIGNAAANKASESLEEAVWTTAQMNDLPDSSFLYVESGGDKDEDGRTKPRSLRHFPYKDASGKIDLPHLRNAIARIPQSSLPADVKERVQAKARNILKDQGGEPSEESLYFSDLGDLKEAELQEGVLRNVTLLRPGWSMNGRYYSPELVARSAGLWEGARAFVDHARKSEAMERPERSVLDVVGYYENARVADDGRVVADLKLAGQHAAHIGALAEESRKTGSDLIGISINALGKVVKGEAEGRKGAVVEDIVKGYSADIVTVPAAGGSFVQIAASDAEQITRDLLASASYQQWREVNPDHLERLRAELKTVRQDDAIKERNMEIDELEKAKVEAEAKLAMLEESNQAKGEEIGQLRTKVAEYESGVLADRLLKESLPELWHEAIRPQLLGKDEEGMKQVIQVEVSKLRALKDKGLLRAEVKGVGQGSAVNISSAKVGAAMLGVNISEADLPRPNESLAEYLARRQEQAELKKEEEKT